MDGPAVQPISPARAKAANIAVEALGIFCDAIENAPGHIGATAIPHRQQPIRDTTALPESEAIRYAPIHKTAPHISILEISVLSSILEKTTLDKPINTAKAHGPSKSPIVFETPSPVSANADAHWLIASSLAPAQIITMHISQKVGFFIIFPNLPFPFSSSRVLIGTNINKNVLTKGIRAQATARIRQFCIPAKRKKSVENRTTAAHPQQKKECSSAIARALFFVGQASTIGETSTSSNPPPIA